MPNSTGGPFVVGRASQTLAQPSFLPFVPEDLNNLVAWYDASKFAFVDYATFDSTAKRFTTSLIAPVPAQNDGDPIARLYDLSGCGNHLTQSVRASQPILRTGANGILNCPAIQFANAGSAESAGTRVANTGYLTCVNTTTFATAASRPVTTALTIYYVVNNNAPSSVQVIAGTDTSAFYIGATSSNRYVIRASTNNPTTSADISSYVANESYAVYTWVLDSVANTLLLYHNGVLIYTTTCAAFTANALQSSGYPLTLGNAAAGTTGGAAAFPFTGLFKSMLIYNEAQSAVQVQRQVKNIVSEMQLYAVTKTTAPPSGLYNGMLIASGNSITKGYGSSNNASPTEDGWVDNFIQQLPSYITTINNGISGQLGGQMIFGGVPDSDTKLIQPWSHSGREINWALYNEWINDLRVGDGYAGTITSSGSNSSTVAVVSGTPFVANQYGVGTAGTARYALRYTSGALTGQSQTISSNTTSQITVASAFTGAPSAGDTFEIIFNGLATFTVTSMTSNTTINVAANSFLASQYATGTYLVYFLTGSLAGLTRVISANTTGQLTTAAFGGNASASDTFNIIPFVIASSTSVSSMSGNNAITVSGTPFTANQYAGNYWVQFTSGTLAGQIQPVLSNTTSVLTTNAFTGNASGADTFNIITNVLGVSATCAWNNFVIWATARRAEGWKVLTTTCLPGFYASGGGAAQYGSFYNNWTPTRESIRQNLNTLIRSGAAYYDMLLDLDINALGNYNGTVSSMATSNAITVSGTPFVVNQYGGYVLVFTSGTLAGQYQTVASNTTSVLTTSAFTGNAAASDTFVLYPIGFCYNADKLHPNPNGYFRMANYALSAFKNFYKAQRG